MFLVTLLLQPREGEWVQQPVDFRMVDFWFCVVVAAGFFLFDC